jgi:hypothetical protein
MKSKEMFEELGYIEVSENYIHLIRYERKIPNSRFDEMNIVEFDTRYEQICVARSFENKCDYGAFYFEDGLLKAINKQVEELGWLGDKE